MTNHHNTPRISRNGTLQQEQRQMAHSISQSAVGRIGQTPILSRYLSNFCGSERIAYPILKIWIGQDRIGNFFPSYPYPILAFVWPDFSLKFLATNVKTLAIVVQLRVLICVIQQNLSFQIFNQEMHKLHIFIILFLQSKTFSDKSVNITDLQQQKKMVGQTLFDTPSIR